MDYLLGGRGWGKTHAAIGWVKGTAGAVLLVHDDRERKRIIRQYDMQDWQVQTYGYARGEGRSGANFQKYAIDNLDLFFGLCGLRNPVALVTAPAGRVVMVGADRANDPNRPGPAVYPLAMGVESTPGVPFVTQQEWQELRAEVERARKNANRFARARDEARMQYGIARLEQAETLAKLRMAERACDEARLERDNALGKLSDPEHKAEVIREALRNGLVINSVEWP